MSFCDSSEFHFFKISGERFSQRFWNQKDIFFVIELLPEMFDKSSSVFSSFDCFFDVVQVVDAFPHLSEFILEKGCVYFGENVVVFYNFWG